jgi:hypothetical protein
VVVRARQPKHYGQVTSDEVEGGLPALGSDPLGVGPDTDASADSGLARFWRDTVESGRVWVLQPWLPIVTAVVWLPLSGAVSLQYRYLLLPVYAFALGFFGMQREWYASAFKGVRPSARRVWTRSWRYFLRFLPVAIVAVVGLPFLIDVVVVRLLLRSASDFQSVRLRVEITFAVWSFVLDFLLTFVMPALVCTTANPFKAFVIGMRYLRRAWRTVKWHALVPPMAVIVTGQIIGGHQTAVAYGMLVTLVGAMLNLLFKGAQLRAYVGHANELGVSIDGRIVDDSRREVSSPQRMF